MYEENYLYMFALCEQSCILFAFKSKNLNFYKQILPIGIGYIYIFLFMCMRVWMCVHVFR